MSDPMNLLSNTYVISDVTTASQQATLIDSDTNQTRIIIDNPGSTHVFVTSGIVSTTAVFPTSATVPLGGKLIAPGSIQTYYKPQNHKFVAAIRETGTADVYITIGSGD